MDKMESEMFPAARVVEEMHQRQRQRKTAASPNTYLPQQSTTRKHSGLSSTQRSGNNVVLGRPDCTVRPEEVNNIRPKKQSTWNPQAQASTGNHAFPEHGRTDVKRRGRGTPVTETFEVKMDDFPELSGIFRNQEIRPPISRDCWGLPPPPMDEYSESAFKMNRNSLSSNYKQSKNVGITSSWEHAQELKNGSTCMTSSWANVASQPPKQPIVKEISKPIELGEEVPELTENTGKKKRKKKKKKGKGTDEDTETESDKQLLNQDPPKFEDEEEFPGLKPGFTWTEKSIKSKTTNLCNNGNPTQSNQQQLKDQKNVKHQSAKSPFIESSKAQKTEKVSGKKSKVPVQLDIGNMLAVLEKKQSQKAKQDTKPLTVSVGGGLPLVPKQQPVQKKSWVQDKVAHNPLDSTSPLVKKGKQREVPKAKKPTALKKVILKEREERKQRRLLEEKGLPLTECDSAPAEDTEEDNGQIDAADGAPYPTEEEVGSAETNDNSNEEKGEDEETVQEQTSTLANSADLPKIHSRKFREYCTQMLSKEVDECVTALLKELVRFQDRLYQKDPMKARMKRRIVMGLREVLKHLKLRKVKCVIISPDCERSQSKGGLDEALHAVFDLCQEQEVPFVFALSRKALGRCVNKVVPVTLVGIFNFDGAQDIYHKMIELSSEARKAYEAMLLSLEQTETEREEEQPLKPDQKDTVSDVTQSPEPEYLKLWKKLLEKESSHTFLNFEAELSSMCLESERTELSDDGAVS